MIIKKLIKTIFRNSVVFIFIGCVLISDKPESHEQTQIRHARDKENLESGRNSNYEKLLNEQWYQENVQEKSMKFSHVEMIEKGCLQFFSGSEENRKEIVPLFVPSSCDYLFKYFIHATVHCNTKGPIPFPLSVKGMSIYWSMEDKKGSVITDVNGKFRLTFISTKSFSIESKLNLYLDEKHLIKLPNAANIILDEELCASKK